MADLARDPVCGMDINPNFAAAHSDYHGQTYYFCSLTCKDAFDKDPAAYLNTDATEEEEEY